MRLMEEDADCQEVGTIRDQPQGIGVDRRVFTRTASESQIALDFTGAGFKVFAFDHLSESKATLTWRVAQAIHSFLEWC